MGGELVRLAFSASFMEDERGRSLTMNERAVLVYMCSVAHDNDAPPLFWAGREAIARFALGRKLDDKTKRSIYETVRTALAGIIDRGMVERVGLTARPGHRQEYAIRVDNLMSLAGMGQLQVVPLATSAWAIDNATLLMAQAPVGPETNNTQDQLLKPRTTTQSSSLAPVDNSDERESA